MLYRGFTYDYLGEANPLIAAEMSSIDLTTPLLNLGVTGVILGWFMLRLETRLSSNENAQNRQARAMLMLVIRLGKKDDILSNEAKGVIAEIDRAEKRVGNASD